MDFFIQLTHGRRSSNTLLIKGDFFFFFLKVVPGEEQSGGSTCPELVGMSCSSRKFMSMMLRGCRNCSGPSQQQPLATNTSPISTQDTAEADHIQICAREKVILSGKNAPLPQSSTISLRKADWWACSLARRFDSSSGIIYELRSQPWPNTK